MKIDLEATIPIENTAEIKLTISDLSLQELKDFIKFLKETK